MGDLSKDFSRSEFACKCGQCGGFPVEPSTLLVARLQAMRDYLNRAIVIASGVRCPVHNAAKGGKPTSDHVTGEGVDVAAIGSRERFEVMEAALYCGFQRVGIDFKSKFMHLGVSRTNDQRVIWGYD